MVGHAVQKEAQRRGAGKAARMGRTMLSGMLSVTTVALLTPMGPSPAHALQDAPDANFYGDEGEIPLVSWNVTLGGEPLASGTAEVPSGHTSGVLAVVVGLAEGAADCLVLQVDGAQQRLDLAQCDDGTYKASATLEDGTHSYVRLQVVDGTQVMGEVAFEHVLVASQMPTYGATFDCAEPGATHDGVVYFADARTLSVTMEEIHGVGSLDLKLNGESVAPQVQGSTYRYELRLENDGAYEVRLEGEDSFGRVPAWSGEGVQLPATFVVDTVAPASRVLLDGDEPACEGMHGGVLYTSHRPSVVVELRDSNLDLESVRIGGVAYEGWQTQGDVHRLELPQGVELDAGLSITGCDWAQNQVDVGSRIVPVIVDAAAPTFEVEHVSPTSVGENDSGTSLFFAEGTSIRLFAADNEGLECIRVEPRDVCDVSLGGFEAGDANAAIELSLKEGVELTQEVQVSAIDLAGNWSTWNIGQHAMTCEGGSERGREPAAVYIDDKGEEVHPLAMLLDTSAPSVAVLGVEEGAAYAGPCEAIVTITEENFSYMQRYGGEAYADQVVGTWHMQNPKPGESGASDEAALRVRDFTRNEITGRWEAPIEFAQDGEYSLHVQARDIVGNVSNEVDVGFLIDSTAPLCEVSFDAEGAYCRAGRVATVRLCEHNWSSMRVLDVYYVDENGKSHALDAGGFEAVGDDWYQMDIPFRADGSYQLCVDATDVAGNKASPIRCPRFVVDSTSPTIRVAYSDGKSGSGLYLSHGRIATITIAEHNWGSDERFAVEVAAVDAADGYVPVVSDWSVPRADRPDEHVCTVDFSQDGRFSLSVRGTDLAGNEALFEGSVGYVASFVVDRERPQVEVGFAPPSYTEYDGTKYVRSVVEVPLSVRDRNLDPSSTTLWYDGAAYAGDEACKWNLSEPDNTGEVVRSRRLVFDHGAHVSPSVVAADLAGNSSRVDGERFVVDLEAPLISKVFTSTDPTATYEGETGGQRGQIQFFGQPTELAFEVEDEFGIDAVSLSDPDGQYRIDGGIERGSTSGRAIVSLVEDSESLAADAYERNIVFSVADIAGNQRSWTLDRRGEVVAERVDQGASVALNGADTPAALVLDGVSPQVAVEGVESGMVTNADVVAQVRVWESRFSYLQVLRPFEAVVRVSSTDATPARTLHEEDVCVGSFEGSGSEWSYVREFSSDGQYSLEASFADIANHPSNHVEVREFTVDKSAPAITVTWDHEMDESRVANGMHYFKTTREATIAVREHNFREQDYAIDAGTAGEVGAWHDEGDDTHTCVVKYGTEAKGCHLLVSGRDEAGNVANSYEQRDFAIDLTPPTARILNVPGPNGERAFAGDLSPMIAFDDGDAGNFDPGAAGWSYRITGMRSLNAAGRGDLRRFRQSEQVSDKGATVSFDEFGKDPDGSGVYELDYDDIYTLEATVCDLAGNVGAPVSVTFSVNRFGSNYFVESADGLEAQGEGNAAGARLLSRAPAVVVHEVNVSGARSERDHSVIRDYANEPKRLVQDAQGESHASGDAGYSVSALAEQSDFNEYAGWSEYVYTIRSGNFGQNALGNGDGQGLYRVNVGSVDAANNTNSTSRYWASDAGRERAVDKSATVAFVLDEVPPAIDGLDANESVVVGNEGFVTFRLTDDISYGDKVEVLVDGEPVELLAAGSREPVDGNAVATGTYAFSVGSRPFFRRSIQIRATDYDGRVATCGGSVYVSTFVSEASLAAALVALGVAGHVIWRRHRDVREPEHPNAV